MAGKQEALFVPRPGYLIRSERSEPDPNKERLEKLNKLLEQGCRVVHTTGVENYVFVVLEHPEPTMGPYR